MDLHTFFTTITVGNISLTAFALLTLVQIVPIKINPWSWIATHIGRAINNEIMKELKCMRKDLTGVHKELDELKEREVPYALVCMFAALRSAFPYGIRKGGVAIEDMTTSDYTKKYTMSDDVFYEYYGTLATVKIHASTDNPENKSVMWINNTADLNKLYYGYYGVTDSGHPTTVPIDTVITSMSEYDVAYTPA